MDSLPGVLIVDDDHVVLRTLHDQIAREGYQLGAFSNIAEAVDRLKVERFGIFIADQTMPDMAGVEFLHLCRESQPLGARVIMTAMESSPGVEEAIISGDAFRALVKPWSRVDLRVMLAQATEYFRLKERLESRSLELQRRQYDLAELNRELDRYRQGVAPDPASQQPQSSDAVAESIFREILCRVDQAVSISDADSNRVLYLSPLHERIWGRPLDELYERSSHWVESIHPGDRDRVLKAAIHASETGTYDEQYRIVRPTGEVRWIRDRAFPISGNRPSDQRIAGIVEDITNRKMANDQLETRVRERTEELAWANLALKSEISERRRAEVQLRETNQRLRNAMNELHATQQQIIQFYRQRDEMELVEPVDLVVALTEAVSMTQPIWRDAALADGRQIAIEQDYKPVPLIDCHGEDIREAAMNLLFNAIDALAEGGKIIVRVYSEERGVVFEIQDNGIGMTEEIRVRCMEPFVTTKGKQGTGLGLTMVYGIVQRHHGEIQIESKVGEGSLVRVRLPFSPNLVN